MDDRAAMLALLQRLAAECGASTDSRPWKARVGLRSGAVVELGQIDLGSLPAVVLEDKGGRTVVYTTLGDVVHLELARGGAPRLEGAVQTAQDEYWDPSTAVRPGLPS